jgi:hypothetical protein
VLGPTQPRVGRFQHLAPTIHASTKQSHDGSQESDIEGHHLSGRRGKVALAEKEGKAALVGEIPQEAP